MEPRMRAVLLLSILAFTALFVLLTVLRRIQLGLEALVDEMQATDNEG
jgi:hypothetical protein